MSSLRLATAVNIRAFQNLTNALSTSQGQWTASIDGEALADEIGRFRVWAGNLGALQKGHSSLDYRLRDSPVLSNNALKLLHELEHNLNESHAVVSGIRLPYEAQGGAAEPEQDDDDDGFYSEDEDDEGEGEPNNELKVRFEDIIDIIDNLYKLSVRIRTPTIRSRSLKASSYTQKDPETGVDVLNRDKLGAATGDEVFQAAQNNFFGVAENGLNTKQVIEKYGDAQNIQQPLEKMMKTAQAVLQAVGAPILNTCLVLYPLKRLMSTTTVKKPNMPDEPSNSLRMANPGHVLLSTESLQQLPDESQNRLQMIPKLLNESHEDDRDPSDEQFDDEPSVDIQNDSSQREAPTPEIKHLSKDQIISVADIPSLRSLYTSRQILQRDQSYAPNVFYNQLISFIHHDLTRLKVDAIVNNAPTDLSLSSANNTLHSAIFKAGGPVAIRALWKWQLLMG
ncbi:hypothetical protein CFE70_001621 [Pyrenophora teres f. teres 0-1]